MKAALVKGLHYFTHEVLNLDFLHDYNRDKLLSDVSAGFVVAVIALPLAIAFGIASGVSPQQGIFTAIICGTIVALFGGTKVQIAGPTGAFVFMTLSAVQTYGYNGLAVATILGGILLIIMAMLKMGNLLRFISTPLIIGLTAGIAFNTLISQLGDFFGLEKSNAHSCIEIIIYTVKSFQDVNWIAVGIALITIVSSQLVTMNFAKIPGPFVSIILTTCLVYFFQLPVETIGSRFGNMDFSFPIPHLPQFNTAEFPDLIKIAVSMAILCGIESLSSALVADSITGERHNPNKELFGQGIANMLGPLFGGIPVSGVIARTTTNIKNGGTTPVAAISHAIFIIIFISLCSKILAFVPMAALAGVLLIVSYNMSGWKRIRSILRCPYRHEKIVLLATLFATVFSGLMSAIELGTVLSAFFFINQNFQFAEADCQIFKPGQAPELLFKEGSQDFKRTNRFDDELLKALPSDITVLSLNGSLFFAAASKFDQMLRNIRASSKYMIVRMDNIQTIDLSGIDVLNSFIKEATKNRQQLFITGANKYCKKILSSGNFKLKNSQIFDSIYEALDQIKRNEEIEFIAKEIEKAKSEANKEDKQEMLEIEVAEMLAMKTTEKNAETIDKEVEKMLHKEAEEDSVLETRSNPSDNNSQEA